MRFNIKSTVAMSVLLVTMFLSMTIVQAQNDTCSTLVETALQSVSNVCNETGRNEICYGNVQLSATMTDTSSDVILESPGDITSIAELSSVQLSSLNLPNDWGIAVMKIQANLPNTSPGQNVMMVLFGDVVIEEQASKLPDALMGTVVTPANIRRGPSTNYGLLGSIGEGTSVEVDARNADGDWFRIYRDDSSDLAWILGSLLEIEGDAENLTVVEVQDPIASAQFGPMQAFLFQSGIVRPTCDEAPPDGILVQTPQGTREINLLINQVDVRLGSTAFMTAAPNDFLTITLLEGQGVITAEGISVTVPAGLRARVPLGDDVLPIGPPELVTYEEAELVALPIANLDDPFDLPEPRPLPTPVPVVTSDTDATSDDGTASATSGVSGDAGDFAGNWFIAANNGASCSTGALLVAGAPQTAMLIEATDGGLSFFGRNVVEVSEGVYAGTTAFPSGDVDYNTLTFTSPNTATWMMSVDTTGTDVFPCKEVVTVVYDLFR